MLSESATAQLVELHRGHTCATWELLVEQSARAAVNRTDYREYVQRNGTYIYNPPTGHEFPLDRYGKVALVDGGGIHSGPCCVRCDMQECVHCHPDFLTEPCEEGARSHHGDNA